MNNQDQAQSEQLTPTQKAKKFLKSTSKPKFPKFLLILLGLVALILIGEGIYYLYLTKNKTSSSQSSSQEDQTTINHEPEAEIERSRYFEGVRYYEGIGEAKHLLVLEGFVDDINPEEKAITLKRDESAEDIQYTESDIIYLIKSLDPLDQEEISFSEIKIGNFISYNPVNESINRIQATWIVQRREQ